MANWVKLTRTTDDSDVWVNLDQAAFFFHIRENVGRRGNKPGTRIIYAGDEENVLDVKEDLDTVAMFARLQNA